MKHFFLLCTALVATTALWAGNVITYTATSKLPMTTDNFSSGLHTNAFNVDITKHSFSDGNGTITFSGEVISIGKFAFRNCSTLTSITIPNSVTSIGSSAFSQCSTLTSITIPNSVTSIGERAFDYCYALTTINVDAANRHYASADGVLFNYTKDTLIQYLNGTARTSYTIPHSVTCIGEWAFSNCSKLTSITIPNSVTSIGHSAFYNCTKLTSITIPNSVTSIGSSAFYRCIKLTSITIPNSVTSIESPVFYDCSALTSINVDAANRYYASVDGVLFNHDKNTLHEYPNGNTRTSYAIPNSVTSIGNYAFYGCSSISTITIPNSVTSIGNYAFEGCSSLPVENNLRYADTYLVKAVNATKSTYIIREGTKWIGNSAFSDCTELTSITIPNSVTSIGNSAFYGCDSLASITIPNSVTSIGNSAFYNCHKLTSITIPNSVTSIGNSAFYNCHKLTSITIPNSVTSIANSAFYGCGSLTSIILPNNVTSIGNSAFYNCYSLSSITIPNSVTSIGKSAFYDCSELTSVTCYAPNPPACGSSCFFRFDQKDDTLYTPLRSITAYKTATIWKDFTNILPILSETVIRDTIKTVVKVGKSYTFRGQTYSESGLYIDTTLNTEGVVTEIHYLELVSMDSTKIIFYTASNKLTETIIDDTRGLHTNAFGQDIAVHTFSNGKGMIAFKDTLRQVGYRAFYGCHTETAATSITLPNTVTSIGADAFYANFSLKTLNIPSGVTSFGDNAFYRCQVLTNITIPEGITTIPYRAFFKCYGFTKLTIPAKIQTMGELALGYCNKLQSLTSIAAVPPTCDTLCFEGVDKSIPLFVPEKSITAYQKANEWKDFTNIQAIPVTHYIVSLNRDNHIQSVSGAGSYEEYSEVTISATASPYYRFDRWSDGNTDNPRTIFLTQNISLTAISATISKGTCGNALLWKYTNGTLSITGTNTMYNYTQDSVPWILFRDSITSIVIDNGATSVGNYAFYGCSLIPNVVMPASITTIGQYAFANCQKLRAVTLGLGTSLIAENAFAENSKLYEITCYALDPPTANDNSFVNYRATLHVPCSTQSWYTKADVWHKFEDASCIGAEETTTTTVTVTPTDNTATITWPTNTDANDYTIEIKKDGIVFCTLTFNAQGQLTNIAFAPERGTNNDIAMAEAVAGGYKFTITSLNPGTKYNYEIDTKNASGTSIANYTGSFTTTAPTALDKMQDSQKSKVESQKIMMDGQLYILREGKMYDAFGEEVR